MSMRITFTDYYTGKKFKTILVKNCGSISFGCEHTQKGERFVIRDYYSNKVLKTCAVPNRSFEFKADEVFHVR